MTARARTRTAKPAVSRLVAIARANGAKGGRPRTTLPQDLIERVGEPPLDAPLQLSRWASKLNTIAGWMALKGKLNKGLADRVRAFAASVTRSQPTDVAAELERLLREDAGDRAVDDVGPQLEKVNGAGSNQVLRANPR